MIKQGLALDLAPKLSKVRNHSGGFSFGNRHGFKGGHLATMSEDYLLCVACSSSVSSSVRIARRSISCTCVSGGTEKFNQQELQGS